MQGAGEANMPGNVPDPLYRQRRCAAVIAGLGWFGLSLQLCFNIHWALVNDSSIPATLINYFSYFTVETNLLIALMLTMTCARPQTEQFLTRPSARSALAVYIMIVGGVYEVLLRNLWQPHGLQLLADILLHDVIPVLYPLYWLAFLPKGGLRWSNPAWWLIYPVLYFLYSMLRGATFGIYLYPFIDVAQLGVARALGNAIVLLAVFFGLGVILTAIDRALASGESARSGLGRAAEL
jgi:hypothetical protein